MFFKANSFPEISMIENLVFAVLISLSVLSSVVSLKVSLVSLPQCKNKKDMLITINIIVIAEIIGVIPFESNCKLNTVKKWLFLYK